MGTLLTGTMKVFKPVTALRLMRQACNLLVINAAKFQTTEAIKKHGSNGAKPEGVLSKAIEHKAEKLINAASKPIEEYQTELDGSMPTIGERIVDIRNMIAECESYMVAWELRGVEAGERPASNKLMMFHAMWYSGLTPVAGVMVACIRMAMAERYVAGMVDLAATPIWKSKPRVRRVNPLPALPANSDEVDAILARARLLTYGVRLHILKDEDFISRRRKRFFGLIPIKKSVEEEPANADLDLADKTGPFAASAENFVREMGGRNGKAHLQVTDDHRVLTYYHMDVTPEERLRPMLHCLKTEVGCGTTIADLSKPVSRA